MSEIKNDPRLKQAAEEAIAKAVDRRVISFTLDGETYWIKRKMSNGRKQFVKYSVEKEFYFEVAKMTIAFRAAPELSPEILVLTPDYMVTRDGGRTLWPSGTARHHMERWEIHLFGLGKPPVHQRHRRAEGHRPHSPPPWSCPRRLQRRRTSHGSLGPRLSRARRRGDARKCDPPFQEAWRPLPHRQGPLPLPYARCRSGEEGVRVLIK